jgi:hypothetical protein
MPGFTETQFTATGPGAVGFLTQPADTNTQFEIGVEVSGLSIGVKGTGTAGEQFPSRPGSAGTGVQGNGSGIGPGVLGVGGNATPARPMSIPPPVPGCWARADKARRVAAQGSPGLVHQMPA